MAAAKWMEVSGDHRRAAAADPDREQVCLFDGSAYAGPSARWSASLSSVPPTWAVDGSTA